MNENLKVIGLEIKDFLAIKHMKIGGDSGIPIPQDMAVFYGENGEGKSDVLKGFEAGLLGITDTSMIRNGADKAEIIIDLSKYRIERRLTRGGTKSLKTTTADKSVSTTLQAFVDDLIGIGDKSKRAFLFSPIDLVLSKDKVKYLRDMFRTTVTPQMLDFVPDNFKAGLDYTKDGMEILAFLSNPKNGTIHVKRGELNKQADQKEALLNDSLSKIAGFSPSEHDLTRVDVLREKIAAKKDSATGAEIKVKLQETNQPKIEKHKADIVAWKTELDGIPSDLGDTLAEYDMEITDLEKQIADLQELLGKKMESRRQVKVKLDRGETLKKDIAKAEESVTDLTVKDIPDLEGLRCELRALSEEQDDAIAEQAKYNLWNEIVTSLRPDYEKAKGEADSLTEILKRLRNELPEQLAKDADMPFEGLRFDGDKVFISAKALNEIRHRLGEGEEATGEISLDNMATHEAMLFGMIGAKKMSQGSPYIVMCMDKLESLDRKSMSVVKDFAAKEGVQILGTYVIHEGEKVPGNWFEVQDGTVKKPEQGTLA